MKNQDKPVDSVAIQILRKTLFILDKKAMVESNNQLWEGFANGNGTEVGKDIDKIIVRIKKYLTSINEL